MKPSSTGELDTQSFILLKHDMSKSALAEEIASFLFTIAMVNVALGDTDAISAHRIRPMVERLPEVSDRLRVVLRAMLVDLREKRILEDTLQRLAKNSTRREAWSIPTFFNPNRLLHWISAVVCVSISGGIAYGVLSLWSNGLTVTVDEVDPEGLFANSRATSRAVSHAAGVSPPNILTTRRGMAKAKQSPDSKASKGRQRLGEGGVEKEQSCTPRSGAASEMYQRRVSYPPFKESKEERDNEWVVEDEPQGGCKEDKNVYGGSGWLSEGGDSDGGLGGQTAWQVASPPFKKRTLLQKGPGVAPLHLSAGGAWLGWGRGSRSAQEAEQQSVFESMKDRI
jgi:hypothetical protein